MTKAAHLNRPSDANASAAQKRATARQEKRGADYNRSMLPALVKEREREYQARLLRAKVPHSVVPMCNSTMPGTYRTGDGEVLQHPRLGSLRAFTLPSHGDRT